MEIVRLPPHGAGRQSIRSCARGRRRDGLWRRVRSGFLWERRAVGADNSDSPLLFRPGGWVLGAKFFSHCTPGLSREAGGQVRASEIGLEGLDRQQAAVLGALRRAAGAPVSYAELRAAGSSSRPAWYPSWNWPASRSSAASARGAGPSVCGSIPPTIPPGDRRRIRRNGARRQDTGPNRRGAPFGYTEPRASKDSSPGSWAGRHGSPPRAGCAAPWRHGARPRAPRPGLVRKRAVRFIRRRRVLALAAFLAVIAGVSVVVLTWAPGGDRATRVSTAKRSHSRAVLAAGGARPAGAPRSKHPSPPVRASPAFATELEAEGHGLLEAGHYGDAVPVLEQAVLATGETLGACLKPASSTCLTYAYALYDLGRALRLAASRRRPCRSSSAGCRSTTSARSFTPNWSGPAKESAEARMNGRFSGSDTHRGCPATGEERAHRRRSRGQSRRRAAALQTG